MKQRKVRGHFVKYFFLLSFVSLSLNKDNVSWKKKNYMEIVVPSKWFTISSSTKTLLYFTTVSLFKKGKYLQGSDTFIPWWKIIFTTSFLKPQVLSCAGKPYFKRIYLCGHLLNDEKDIMREIPDTLRQLNVASKNLFGKKTLQALFWREIYRNGIGYGEKGEGLRGKISSQRWKL